MSQTAEQTQSTPLVKAEPKTPIAIVSNTIRGYLDRKTLHLPSDYSAENALKAAWLTIQNVQDMNKRPALEVCTQTSIVNAMMSMVIQGLNPDKKQCYFIVYGNALTLQRSYFGDEALVRRVKPGSSLYYDVIYSGEKILVEKHMSSVGLVTVIKSHEIAFPRTTSEIVGAYCGVVDGETGENLGIELMSIDQIKKSWSKSKTYKEGGNSFHNDQPDQACLRTVIRRRCKPVINSSNDELLMSAIAESERDQADAEIAEEASIHANGEVIDLVPAIAPTSTSVILSPVEGAASGEGQEGASDDSQKGALPF